jgi:hypothetical protein
MKGSGEAERNAGLQSPCHIVFTLPYRIHLAISHLPRKESQETISPCKQGCNIALISKCQESVKSDSLENEQRNLDLW